MRSDSLLDVMRDLVTNTGTAVTKEDFAALEQRVERLDELLMKLEQTVKRLSDEDFEPNMLKDQVLSNHLETSKDPHDLTDDLNLPEI